MKFVTSNRHKFEEISHLFKASGLELEWKEMRYDEMQEDYTELISFKSCIQLSKALKGSFFLEDTGLYVNALSGFPGPYSAYVSRTLGNDGILRLLDDDRRATFKTVVSYFDGSKVRQFGGIVNGSIATEVSGSGGFGFDPIFIPSGYKKTLGQMSIDEKNSTSHRARAISRFISYLIG